MIVCLGFVESFANKFMNFLFSERDVMLNKTSFLIYTVRMKAEAWQLLVHTLVLVLSLIEVLYPCLLNTQYHTNVDMIIIFLQMM